MNMTKKNTDATASEAEALAPASAGLSKRRRFIRLGASAVPVIMTLTSRPVMAWHCNTTSAWGSARLANNIGSAKTRLDGGVVNGNETWTIDNWTNNNITGSNISTAPWEAVRVAMNLATVALAQAQLTVVAIFPGGLTGVAGTNTVLSVLSGGTSFQRSVTVARLNTIYVAPNFQILINNCIVSADTGLNGGDQVQRMAALGSYYFSPNAPGSYWSEVQIVEYLFLNWLAR